MSSQPPSGGIRMDSEGQENSAPAAIVVAISSNAMGRGDELGQVLLRTYLHTLGEVTPRPDTIIFFNTG